MLVALLVAPSASAGVGALTVRLEASVGEPRPTAPGVTRWAIEGRAVYRGSLDGRTSTLTFSDDVDIGGLERDETFVCGVVTVELGGPCVAVGPIAALGTARIVEHDLRLGGRLVWELVFPSAVCPPCAAT